MMWSKKCDGCGVKLKDDDYTQIKFRVTEEETGEQKEGTLTICPNCAKNIEQVLKQEVIEGRAQSNESL